MSRVDSLLGEATSKAHCRQRIVIEQNELREKALKVLIRETGADDGQVPEDAILYYFCCKHPEHSCSARTNREAMEPWRTSPPTIPWELYELAEYLIAAHKGEQDVPHELYVVDCGWVHVNVPR